MAQSWKTSTTWRQEWEKEIRNRHHMRTGTQEVTPYCSLELRQENKGRRALQVSHNFAVKTPLATTTDFVGPLTIGGEQ